MKKKIFIYLFDGYSDWEIAYLTPVLNKSDLHVNYLKGIALAFIGKDLW